MTAPEILAALRAQANPKNVAGMARYGISTQGTLGVPVVVIRRLAKQAGRSHELAAELWASGIHEARILATIVDRPELGHPPPDEPLGARFRFLGRVRSGLPESLPLHAVRLGDGGRSGPAPSANSCAAPAFR